MAPPEPFVCGAPSGSPATWRLIFKARKQFLETHDCQSIVGFLFLWPKLLNDRQLKGKMKKKNRQDKYRQVKTRFAPVTRFDLAASVPVPPRGPVEGELEQLKARLLQPLLTATVDPGQAAPLQRAANEAASLAWFTPFPLLFFPALLDEKVRAAQRQHARQRQIREQTEPLVQTVVE